MKIGGIDTAGPESECENEKERATEMNEIMKKLL